jgi:hypothetical protein
VVLLISYAQEQLAFPQEKEFNEGVPNPACRGCWKKK